MVLCYQNQTGSDIRVPMVQGTEAIVPDRHYVIDNTGFKYQEIPYLTLVDSINVNPQYIAYTYAPIEYAPLDSATGRLAGSNDPTILVGQGKPDGTTTLVATYPSTTMVFATSPDYSIDVTIQDYTTAYNGLKIFFTIPTVPNEETYSSYYDETKNEVYIELAQDGAEGVPYIYLSEIPDLLMDILEDVVVTLSSDIEDDDPWMASGDGDQDINYISTPFIMGGGSESGNSAVVVIPDSNNTLYWDEVNRKMYFYDRIGGWVEVGSGGSTPPSPSGADIVYVGQGAIYDPQSFMYSYSAGSVTTYQPIVTTIAYTLSLVDTAAHEVQSLSGIVTFTTVWTGLLGTSSVVDVPGTLLARPDDASTLSIIWEYPSGSRNLEDITGVIGGTHRFNVVSSRETGTVTLYYRVLQSNADAVTTDYPFAVG